MNGHYMKEHILRHYYFKFIEIHTRKCQILGINYFEHNQHEMLQHITKTIHH